VLPARNNHEEIVEEKEEGCSSPHRGAMIQYSYCFDWNQNINQNHFHKSYVCQNE
jgi:hypothetical protein